jgi:hypothetical protein
MILVIIIKGKNDTTHVTCLFFNLDRPLKQFLCLLLQGGPFGQLSLGMCLGG